MSHIQISIFADDRDLLERQVDELSSSSQVGIVSKDIVRQRSEEWSYLMEVVLQVSGSIAVGIVSNWVYDLIVGGGNRIELNRRVITVDDEGRIREIIEESITAK